MTKAEKATLEKMTPTELIEGFVRESKLYELSDVPRANKALESLIIFGDEIVRRGGTSSLVQLTDRVPRSGVRVTLDAG